MGDKNHNRIHPYAQGVCSPRTEAAGALVKMSTVPVYSEPENEKTMEEEPTVLEHLGKTQRRNQQQQMQQHQAQHNPSEGIIHSESPPLVLQEQILQGSQQRIVSLPQVSVSNSFETNKSMQSPSSQHGSTNVIKHTTNALCVEATQDLSTSLGNGQDSFEDLSSIEDYEMAEEAGKWRYADKRHTCKRKSSGPMDDEGSIPNKTRDDNRYKILLQVDVDNQIENIGNKNNNMQARQVNNNDSNTNNSTDKSNSTSKNANSNSNVTEKKYKFLPPIIMKGDKWNLVYNSLKKWNVQFKYKVRNNTIKLFIREDFYKQREDLLDDFKKNGLFDAYTYTHKSERPIVILIKGVHWGLDIEQVKEDFQTKFPETEILSIKRFETTKSKKENTILNTIRIVLAPGANVSEIMKTELICHSVVNWERPKSEGPVRCANCQKFGHLAVNCFRQPQCVRCALHHAPGQCQWTEGQKVACANCGQEGHPASYRGCIFYKKYVQRLKDNRRKNRLNQNPKNFMSTSSRIPGVSYANALRENFPPLGKPAYSSAENYNAATQDYSQKTNGFNLNGNQFPGLNPRPIQKENFPQNNNSRPSGPIEAVLNLTNEEFGVPYHVIVEKCISFLRNRDKMPPQQRRLEHVRLIDMIMINGIV